MITAAKMKALADECNNQGLIRDIEAGINLLASKGEYSYGVKIKREQVLKANIESLVEYFKNNGFDAEAFEQQSGGYYLRIRW